MIASPVDTHGIERQSELSAAASVALSASKVTATAHLAEPDAKEVKRKMKRFAVRMAGVGGIGGLLFGYDLGVVAGALLQLKTHFSLGKTGGGLVVSMLLAGSVCGSLGGGVLTDFYGRKRAILITDVVFIVGSLLIAVAQTIEGVLLGRFIVGVGVSVSAIADVSYLNEMAPKIWRGAIVSVNEMMIAAGFALAAVVDWYFATTDEGWRYMFGGSAILAVAQLLMMLPMPRSPRWLMLKGHEVRCQSAHCTLRNRTKNSVMHGFTGGGQTERAADLRLACRRGGSAGGDPPSGAGGIGRAPAAVVYGDARAVAPAVTSGHPALLFRAGVRTV